MRTGRCVWFFCDPGHTALGTSGFALGFAEVLSDTSNRIFRFPLSMDFGKMHALAENAVAALHRITLASQINLRHFSEKPIHLTGAECCAAQKLETGWLLTQALQSQPESVWQLVRARQRRRPPNQLERTR
jgi:hypothetical protein